MSDQRERNRFLTTAAARRAVDLTPRPTIRAGTVAQAAAPDRTVAVVIDGDAAPSICEVVGGDVLAPGDRVMVQFYPPHGAYVLGVLGGGAGSLAVSDYGEVGGGAAEDLTSAVFATFPSNASFTFTAPAAATAMIAEFHATGIQYSGGRNQAILRAATSFGAVGNDHYYEGTGGGGVNNRLLLGCRALFLAGPAFTPGLPVTIVQQGRRTIGPGLWTRDALSRVTLVVTWK